MPEFRSVAAYAPQGVTALGLGVVNEIFRRPGFDFVICAERPGTLRTDLGLPLPVEHGLDRLAGADLVLALPGVEFRADPPRAVLAALCAAYGRGAIIAAHCVGSFLLAAAGLLDGLEATTHWRFAADLAARHPAVRVRPESLYVDQGRIVTGAGAVAGIDLCLYLIRREHGAGRANAIARDLVTTPYRSGGQRQYLPAPVPDDGDDERLSEVIAWARAGLDRRISVDDLAARALMSRRSFARRFKAATGTTPHAWLLAQRLNLAEELLETTDLSVENIAHQVGYRSAAVFREQFALRRGVPPRDYRRAFRQR
ncbi:GlxA family transcriptional regulator [Streptosporangium sp. NPDC000396]|uniref:GlxA family transcriptional regulator n=1 Tax=Streptosporangium sp. NPDC000396 TaxID=3366185 RepID=UPI0036B164A1